MSQPHRPQRLTAMLAVVGIAATGALALPSIARADGETSHDRWCREGEGQTVVIDWRITAEKDPERQLIRCIKLAAGATVYPLDGKAPPLTNPLESANIPYEIALNGVFTSINNQTLSEGFSWHWSTGTPIAGDAEGGQWEGKPDWEPVAGVDTVVGITLTDKTEDASRLPATSPQFDPSDAPPDPSPTPSDSKSSTTSPSASVSKSATSTASNSGTATPTVSASTSASRTSAAPRTTSAPATTATPTAATTPAATNTTASTQRPTRTQRPNRPPRRTTRPRRPTNLPQPPMYPPAPPVPPAQPTEYLPEPPPEVPSDISEGTNGQATDGANPTPSRVWGREDATRQSSEATRSDKPAPWSQLAAVAGAVVVVGGLGTAFARGLQTSTPPVVEEE